MGAAESLYAAVGGWVRRAAVLTPRLSLVGRTARQRLTRSEKKMWRHALTRQNLRERRREARERRRSAKAAAQAEDAAALAAMDPEARARLEADRAVEAQRARAEAYARRNRENERLAAALADGSGAVRVAVDLSYGALMNAKERRSLGKQLQLCYVTNRASERPVALHFCGLAAAEAAFPDCLPQGYGKWAVRCESRAACEAFRAEEVVYLSPDAPRVLEEVDPAKVYVIGGLVDGTVIKRATLSAAEAASVEARRLPVKEHLKGTDPVLNVNHVLEALIAFQGTGDWARALEAAVPPRKRKAGTPGEELRRPRPGGEGGVPAAASDVAEAAAAAGEAAG